MQALIMYPEFKPDNIRDINFHQIEEELCSYSSQEQGWKKTKIYIGVPTAQKWMVVVQQENTVHQVRLWNAPCHPPSTKASLYGFLITIRNFHHCLICEVISETFS